MEVAHHPDAGLLVDELLCEARRLAGVLEHLPARAPAAARLRKKLRNRLELMSAIVSRWPAAASLVAEEQIIYNPPPFTPCLTDD